MSDENVAVVVHDVTATQPLAVISLRCDAYSRLCERGTLTVPVMHTGLCLCATQVTRHLTEGYNSNSSVSYIVHLYDARDAALLAEAPQGMLPGNVEALKLTREGDYWLKGLFGFYAKMTTQNMRSLLNP